MRKPTDWSAIPIRLIPRVETLAIERAGPWRDVEFAFGPGLNVITGDGVTGKSSVLLALLSAACPDNGPDFGPLRLDDELSATVVYHRPRATCDAMRLPHIPADATASAGERAVSVIAETLDHATAEHTVVVDDGLTSCLTRDQSQWLLSTLAGSVCQSIVVLRGSAADDVEGPACTFVCERDGHSGLASVSVSRAS